MRVNGPNLPAQDCVKKLPVALFATNGSELKTNNGMRVAQGPNGKTCAKVQYEQGYTR